MQEPRATTLSTFVLCRFRWIKRRLGFETAQSLRAAGNWKRFVQQVFSIRHLQRIFHNSGQALQWYPRSLLDRASKCLPKEQ